MSEIEAGGGRGHQAEREVAGTGSGLDVRLVLVKGELFGCWICGREESKGERR